MILNELQQLYASHPNVEAVRRLLDNPSIHHIYCGGLCASSASLFSSVLVGQGRRPYVFILGDLEEAGYFYHDLVQVLGDAEVLFFPSSFRRAIKYGQKDAANEILRTEVLSRLQKADHALCVVTYPDALAEKVVSRGELDEKTLKLHAGEKVDMTTEGAQITNSTSVMMTTVAGDEYAIGYVSLGTLDDSVKALKIDGAEATAENIKSGDYKVSRPFNIATKTDLDNPVADDFIAFIMSQEGQDVVSAEGYIPLDGAEAYAGEAPEGKAVVGGSSSVSPLMEKLIEAYAEVNPNAEIELQTTDSTTGMESAISGAYDIGMASREVKDEEIEGGLEAQVIATDGIAVVVNNNNPTDELSSDQVKSIYVGDVTTWDAV